jgi:ABC-type xylose transport system permease subunit
MLKRLTVGLVEGLVLGALMALLTIKLLGLTSFGGAIAYLIALVMGALTGLVAGKPIWAREAKIEAGLKAVVGAGLSAGLLWMLRRWANVDLDLSAFGAGAGKLGELPAASLPLIAAALSVLFEIDNTGGPKGDSSKNSLPKTRVDEVIGREDTDALEDEVDAGAAQRRAHKG